MQIETNYNLSGFNTFGVEARTRLFVRLTVEGDIPELLQSSEFKNNEKLFLGGGSNVLFTKDFEGIIVHNEIEGISVTKEDEEFVCVRAMSGESWHELVLFVVDRGWWGLENLSFIPGSVGGAPMQNIGAYGAEVKDVIDSVETYEIATGEKKVFLNSECKFGYRDSVFKNEAKGRYFISAVNFRLNKTAKPNTDYKILREYLTQNGIEARTPKDISDAVTAIRKSKLPDPKDLGNSGSFFKNVFVSKEEMAQLKDKFPDIPSFEEDKKIKIPSAWLIEYCGFKGYREGSVGVHEKQALVLVNYGGGTGLEILNLSNKIIDAVYQKFGLKLTPEVNLI